MLGGNGTVGSVTNKGNVSTDEGTLTINGDYTQSSDATLTYKVGNGVSVTGMANIDGSLNVTATAAKYVATGEHTVFKCSTRLNRYFCQCLYQ